MIGLLKFSVTVTKRFF